MRLLTTNNYKILKAKGFGYLQVGLHLAPYDLSGHQVCAYSTSACRKSCLFRAGNGSMTKIQKGRIKKTQYFFENTEGFLAEFDAEIYYYERIAKKEGLILVIRPNLTSDIDFQKIIYRGQTIFEMFPHLQFFDYTKDYKRISLYPNYDLTYSYDQINHKKAMNIVNSNKRLAVVFEDKLPETFLGRKVINGDVHDLTFLHPENVILGLKYKNITTLGFNNKENIKTSTLVVKQNNHFNKIKYDSQTRGKQSIF